MYITRTLVVKHPICDWACARVINVVLLSKHIFGTSDDNYIIITRTVSVNSASS